MKTKEQILRFISQNEFKDKDDWGKVLAWCRDRYGGGKAHKALLPIGQSTYEEFLRWLDDGIAVGDVVKSGDLLGIVGGYSLQKAYLSVIVSDDSLIQKKVWIKPNNIVIASEKEQSIVADLMREQKESFYVPTSRMVRVYVPENGDYVEIVQEKKIVLGIFKERDKTCYLFHGIVERGKFVKEFKLPIDGYELKQASKTEINAINAALDVSGLRWLSESKRVVEAAAQRVKSGGYYWYMTERFMPESDKDMYNKRSDDRFECGNYFKTFKECYEFCLKVKNIRAVAKQRLTEPINDIDL